MCGRHRVAPEGAALEAVSSDRSMSVPQVSSQDIAFVQQGSAVTARGYSIQQTSCWEASAISGE